MKTALRIFWRAVDAFLATVLTAMIMMVFVNVVLRYGFASGIRESIELSRMSLVWLVMIGAAAVLRRDEHLAVSDIVRRFPVWLQLWLRRLSYGVILVAGLMLLVGAWGQTSNNWANISPLTGLPSAIFHLSGVIAAILFVVISVIRIINPDARLDGGHDADLRQGDPLE